MITPDAETQKPLETFMSLDPVLENRDYTLMIDKSSSMATADEPGGKTRWELAQESTIALAQKCEEIDPDGILQTFII